MANQSYNLFCPTAMAAELLEPRWTMLILCEMGSGSRNFADIQRGVPGMSPSLLSRRLRGMEAAGLIMREDVPGTQKAHYLLTTKSQELLPIINELGHWAHRHLDSRVALDRLDDRMLMWNVRRKIVRTLLPQRRTVVEFLLDRDDGSAAKYWLIMRPGQETDLCSIGPKFDVDLYIVASLRDFTSAWMGHSRFETEIGAGRIKLIGDAALAQSLTRWMVRSCFATDQNVSADNPAAAARVRAV
ncbi:helix-turn-helix transcriptional regulator [Defluviimonas sp. WL0002]|uniref:Helix-turn-helix transcriptional regulator n=2 Tax=Albidovulum marisflavi TaxID=2984159 RepID=A0ABT2ZFL6_9RHOB|nr:helix-turn-helix transcriptional regulator [Defluviimonas sp. WL0002]